MPIQKPDFNQIFASQAPDVDKPPVFNNYNGGWGDESRPNNGKPTIKGFNYLQQQTDNKLLWMMQNGAFPYDSTVDYAVGVVTVKDGRFKQWNGTTWVNFGQDDGALKSTNNLSDLPNKPRARTNLDVYSTAQVNAAITAAIPPETPVATETVAGKAKIATTAIAQEGVNDTDFLTAKKLADTVLAFAKQRRDLTGQRFANTTYVNTNPYPIFVTISAYNTSIGNTLKIGSDYKMLGGNAGGSGGSWTISTIVMPAEQYMYNGPIYSWIEVG